MEPAQRNLVIMAQECGTEIMRAASDSAISSQFLMP
jgi:hypothetical protein